MFNSSMNVGDIAHAIELALSPALLLVGINGILAIMTGRFDRIIDRGRQLTEDGVLGESQAAETIQRHLRSLEKMRHLASSAIASFTISALFLCSVIVALFLEALLQVRLGWLLGILFTCSTLAMVVGLAYFLAEIRIAIKTVSIPIRLKTLKTEP
jgi:hypothetical protein